MHIKLLFILLIISTLCFVNISSYSNVTEELILLSSNASPCERECVSDGIPMLCRYKFTVEWYETMSRACYDCPRNKTDCSRPDCIPGDGISRAVVVINRKMPGPNIIVCEGDEIVVDVENRLHNEETTMHWHGLHQKDTPYMDGVPHLTQCPIASNSMFRYHFYTTHHGTQFWHSHSALQRGEGAFGPLIIRQPKDKDPHGSLYDFDLTSHIISAMDWIHILGTAKFTNHHHSDGNNKPDTLLINGFGYLQTTNYSEFVPAPQFTVQQGFRYRFRLINAAVLNCPIEVSVDNHTMLVISSDGHDFEPITVESFVSYAGERFDFILDANQTVGNYWIRFRGLMDCDERFTSAHQIAILHYNGADPETEPEGEISYSLAHKDGLQLNALNKGVSDDDVDAVNLVNMNAILENDIALKNESDYKFFISYDFHNISNTNFYMKGQYEFNSGHSKFQFYTPQLNHITNIMQAFPLLSGRDLITPDMFCNESTVQNCTQNYCQCTHVLQVALDSVVEVILIDKGFTFNANHPFHLHGYSFRVVAMERLGENITTTKVRELDRLGLIDRKLDRAPIKDSVTVPDGGYTVIRFQANNPGYWILHCHIDFHAVVGMSVVFKVGEHSDIAPVPKDFPKCDNWLPPIDGNACEQVSIFHRIIQKLHLEKECHSGTKSVQQYSTSMILISVLITFHLFRR